MRGVLALLYITRLHIDGSFDLFTFRRISNIASSKVDTIR